MTSPNDDITVPVVRSDGLKLPRVYDTSRVHPAENDPDWELCRNCRFWEPWEQQVYDKAWGRCEMAKTGEGPVIALGGLNTEEGFGCNRWEKRE